MNRLFDKKQRFIRRVKRIKHAIRSRNARPRLIINRTNRYLSAQIIDDAKMVTVCSASTLDKSFKGSKKNKEAAVALGKIIAQKATEKGIKSVVFDRRGRLYHGRIQMFADAAREGGLEF